MTREEAEQKEALHKFQLLCLSHFRCVPLPVKELMKGDSTDCYMTNENYLVMNSKYSVTGEVISEFISSNELSSKELDTSLFALGDILNDKVSNFEFYLGQLGHYLSYALAEDAEGIWIPNEKLPSNEKLNCENDHDVYAVVIRTVSIINIFTKIMAVLSNGIALSPKAVDDYVFMLDYIIKSDDTIMISEIYKQLRGCKNREIKYKLIRMGIIQVTNASDAIHTIHTLLSPTPLYMNNQRFLRKAWSSHIHDGKLDDDIVPTVKAIFNGIEHIEYAKLYYRHKHALLLLKSIKAIDARAINYITSKSKKVYKPVRINTLNFLSTMNVSTDDLMHSNISTVLRALSYCKNNMRWYSDILASPIEPPSYTKFKTYTIRNKSTFTKIKKKGNGEGMDLIMRNSEKIISYLRNNYHVNYASIKSMHGVKLGLPTTAKNFLDDRIPSNTIISLHDLLPEGKNDIIVGIHWRSKKTDESGESFGTDDLDLSMTMNNEYVGWGENNKSKGLRFSGDVRYAPDPDGATEYIRMNMVDLEEGIGNMNINIYTYQNHPVDCTFFIANASEEVKADMENIPTNLYYSNEKQPNGKVFTNLKPEDIFFKTKLRLYERNTGIISVNGSEKTIVLANITIDKSIYPQIPGSNIFELKKDARVDFYKSIYNTLNLYTLNDILAEVWAVFENDKNYDSPAEPYKILDISDLDNLSLDVLTDIFHKNED